MKQQQTNANTMIQEVAARIQELRDISGYSQEEMARYTDLELETYRE